MAATAAVTIAGARDATRLEQLVCFMLYLYFIILMIILGPLNMSKRRWQQRQQQQQQHQGTCLEPLVRMFSFYYISFCYTNVYFRST
jgi:hypothetical protein